MKKITLLTLMLLILPICYAEIINEFSGSNTFSHDFDTAGSSSTSIEITESGQCIDSATVTVSGIPIESTEEGDADVVLTTDVSGSMGSALSGSTRIEWAKKLDKDFITNVLAAGSGRNIALVSYNQNAYLDNFLSSSESTLNSTINGYSQGGYTCIACGIVAAINELRSSRANPSATPTIILMTDGQANRCYNDGTSNPWRGVSCSDAEADARNRACDTNDPNSAVSLGITIHTIAFGAGAAQGLMDDIADCTGGLSRAGDTAGALQNVYEEIAKTITSSSNPTPSINIDLGNNPDFSTSDTLDGSIVWTGSCPSASCISFSTVIQENLDACTTPPCTVNWDVSTSTAGTINLSNLYIETSPCIVQICGNGILENPEECDEGGNNGNICIPGYNGQCTYCDLNCHNVTINGGYCGDNNINPPDETCDPQTSICLPPYEGQCSYCDATCQNVTLQGGYCGDGNTDSPQEDCDAGANNGNVCTAPYNGQCTYCDLNCQNVTINGGSCGDGIRQEPNEYCDLGAQNGVPGSGCLANCDYEPPGVICGNGILEYPEDCDEGNGYNRDDGKCNLMCHSTYCGDGIRQNPNGNNFLERCDGVLNCQANCEWNPVTGPDCGNGILELGEECDEGNNNNNYGSCLNSCVKSHCGDGFVQRPNADGDYEDCEGVGIDCDATCHYIPISATTQITVKGVDFDAIDLQSYVPYWVENVSYTIHVAHLPSGLYADNSSINTLLMKVTDPTYRNDPDGYNVLVTLERPDTGARRGINFNFLVRDVPLYTIQEPDESRLLVSKEKIITSQYTDELMGDIIYWGPYTITVKMWEKNE